VTQVQHKRLEEYENAAVESEMLSRLTTERSKQAVYEHIAEHFRDLATGFRQALGEQQVPLDTHASACAATGLS
jgi:hypothetical protein